MWVTLALTTLERTSPTTPDISFCSEIRHESILSGPLRCYVISLIIVAKVPVSSNTPKGENIYRMRTLHGVFFVRTRNLGIFNA